ncbi:MAG: hypothetical protein PVF70_08065 [Anaerolineales bacterium]
MRSAEGGREHVTQRGFTRSDKNLAAMLRNIASLFLRRDTGGATFRLFVVGGSLLVYWFTLTLVNKFPSILPPAWQDSLPFPFFLLLDFIASFFAPRIMAHFLPVIIALWLGLRVGANYITDLYELESPAIAFRHLLASLFGIRNHTLEISGGQLHQLDQSNPLVRIGGPGHLTVHLGFAAVFESVEGRPKVYGPAEKRFIQGFERLRDVIDLRDQMQKVNEVLAMTRDGIEVRARDAQMVFRVFSGGRPRSLQDPYPFTEDAVRRLVYGRAVSASGSRKWTDLLPTLVSNEIRNFVAALTIEEFLALQPRQLPEEDQEDGGDPTPEEAPSKIHIPRRHLTERFHTKETRQRLIEHGLELAWVGVGTWEVYGTASAASAEASAGKTLISSWRDMQRARMYREPEYLKRQRRLGFESYAGRVLRELVGIWQEDQADDQARCWALLAWGFQKHLLEIRRSLTADPDNDLPLDFQQTLMHLHSLAKPDTI